MRPRRPITHTTAYPPPLACLDQAVVRSVAAAYTLHTLIAQMPSLAPVATSGMAAFGAGTLIAYVYLYTRPHLYARCHFVIHVLSTAGIACYVAARKNVRDV